MMPPPGPPGMMPPPPGMAMMPPAPGGKTVKEEETVITTVTTVEPIYSRDKFIQIAKRSICGSAVINLIMALIAMIMSVVAMG